MQTQAAEPNALACALETIGVAVLIYLSFRLVRSCLEPLRAFVRSRRTDIGCRGEWAVVTGASAGIGKGYAEHLAASGMNIVLIGCFPVELQDVATAFEATYHVKTRIIVADFTEGCHLYHRIEQQLADLDISVLINNVGIYYRFPEYFHLVPGSACLSREEKHSAMIKCNTLSGTTMTFLILPKMLSKRKGVIVNIGSYAGDNIFPLYAVYSATKSYVATFTRILQQEYASQGLIIQHVSPNMVAKESNGLKPSFFGPTATTFARSALSSVGILSDTSGCLAHWLLSSFSSMLPVGLKNAATLKYLEKFRVSA